MTSILIILFFIFLAWFWLNSIRIKEIALQASEKACNQIQAQFLDQTASLEKIKFIENSLCDIHPLVLKKFVSDNGEEFGKYDEMINEKLLNIKL